MKHYFPPIDKVFKYLQTNRSDVLGSLWSTFNIDLQSNLGQLRVSSKLVTTTIGASIGLASVFNFFHGVWYAIIGTKIYKKTGNGVITGAFSDSNFSYKIGSSTTRFDITNPSGTTFRYTWDGTGTDPGITALTIPIGASIAIDAQNFNAANNIPGVATGSGNNYFEMTNAAGVAESDKTIGTGYIQVSGGGYGSGYDAQKSDSANFNNQIWFTEKTKLSALEGNDMIIRDVINDSLHKLAYLKKFDRLYYTDNKVTIKSIDTSNVVASSGDYFINIGNSLGEITTIISDTQKIFIATLMTNDSIGDNSVGSILVWDGISSQITAEYKLKTAGVLAMVSDGENVCAIDTEGRILKYTGYSFTEIARLPINKTLLTNATTTEGTSRFVHFNGMEITKDNTLLVAVNNLNSEDDDSVNENLPSGIWECDLSNGNFIHKYSFTLKAYDSATITDFGQNKISAIGAIKLNPMNAASNAGRGSLLAGATYFTDATTTASCVFIDSPSAPDSDVEGQKRGYFITTWFNATDLVENFVRLSEIHRRFLNATDKMIFKYRLIEEAPVVATITWVDTTHFTTTTNISAYGPTQSPFEGSIGGEVEILQGKGAGACVHITAISEVGGTYTVTVDNVVTGMTTGTAKARFQKWIKILPESIGQIVSYSQMDISKANTRIQIKCAMEFTGDNEFSKFVLFSRNHIELDE